MGVAVPGPQGMEQANLWFILGVHRGHWGM